MFTSSSIGKKLICPVWPFFELKEIGSYEKKAICKLCDEGDLAYSGENDYLTDPPESNAFLGILQGFS